MRAWAETKFFAGFPRAIGKVELTRQCCQFENQIVVDAQYFNFYFTFGVCFFEQQVLKVQVMDVGFK